VSRRHRAAEPIEAMLAESLTSRRVVRPRHPRKQQENIHDFIQNSCRLGVVFGDGECARVLKDVAPASTLQLRFVKS
jgi:hypothetical protein